MHNLILTYFPDLTPLQLELFARMQSLYASWNEQINVISRKDMENFYERHVLHSLGIARVIQFEPGTSVLDVGTGGGFPGIPLAVMFPETEFLLVDSIGKKIKVVEAVASELGLTNVRALNCRAENLEQTFHFIVSRAVTTLPEFLGWTGNKIIRKGFNSLPNGILYLKGGDLSGELAGIRMKHQVYELSRFFREEFFETKKVVHLFY